MSPGRNFAFLRVASKLEMSLRLFESFSGTIGHLDRLSYEEKTDPRLIDRLSGYTAPCFTNITCPGTQNEGTHLCKQYVRPM